MRFFLVNRVTADFDATLLVDRVIQEEGLYVYKMHNIIEKLL
jgi:hypothetical protein